MQQIRPRLEEGWLTWLLLWGMIIISAAAIIAADLIDGLHILPMAATLALLAGTLLAKSRFSSNTAHFLSLVYGLFVIFLLIGSILPGELIWRERVFDIVSRQAAWLGKAFNGGTSRDRLIFVIHTAAIYWLLGYTAAWFTFRKPRVWRAVIPTGVVLLSVVYYYIGPKPLPLYLAAYIVLSLLFIARTHLAEQERDWKATAVRYEKGIWLTFVRAGFLVGLVVLIVAWSLPTMAASSTVNDALSGTRGPWHAFQDDWTRLFSALRSYGSDTTDPYQDSLVLSGPRSVGSAPIMDVYVPRELPYIYWQAVVYDTYEDGRWEIANGETNLHFPDDGFLNTPETFAREVITQTIVTYLPNSSFLYAAPEVVGTSKQMYVDSRQDEEGNELITSLRSRYLLRQGDRYKVASRISNADVFSLRNASTIYPDWALDSYLQLPDSISSETLALADELTAALDTPYDKAIAVRDWLRNNITYNDQIPAPPEDVDPVHYTLFVSQEGYCNYYASAMAVMLRSQGIPARVVSGYAQGDFDDETTSYRVRASNAHTWTEVYFPQYGWIQFEPTAAIPVVVRRETIGGPNDSAQENVPIPDGDLPVLDSELDDSERLAELLAEEEGAAPVGEETAVNPLPTWQIVGALMVVVLAGGTLLIANSLNRRVETDVDRSYGRLSSWGRWLGIFFRPTQTPYERADMMATAVPEGKASIRNLTRQFVLKQFSPSRATEPDFEPQIEWRQLRPLLYRRAIVSRVERWQKRLSGIRSD